MHHQRGQDERTSSTTRPKLTNPTPIITGIPCHSYILTNNNSICFLEINLHTGSDIASCIAFLPSRWKYENWRIHQRFTCPGSTRYGRRHRQKNNPNSSSDTSRPVTISHSEVKKHTMNTPSPMSPLSCLGYSMWINSQVLVFLIMLLCLTPMPSRHIFFSRRSYSVDLDAKSNSISTHHQRHWFSPQLFSLPLNWSLPSVLVCSSTTRHIAVIPKTIGWGINPIYMVNPYESGQSDTNTKEDPDWLLNFKKQRSEASRKMRAKTVKEVKEKKSAVPGWMRSRQCRERKAATTQVKSSTVTQVTNDESRYTRNDTSLMWLYPALICSVLILTLFILFRSNLTAAIPRR